MAIEPAGRYHPARWIILGPVLFVSLLSMGVALLAVLGAPPWTPATGTAAQAIHPPPIGQRAVPPPRSVTAPPAAIRPTSAAPIGAGPPASAYHPAVVAAHRTYGYQRSLLYSGMLGLAIAVVGLTMVSRRRQMW